MDRKGQEWDVLIPWMIGIFIVVLSLVLIGIYTGVLGGAGSFLGNIFRFG